MAIRMRKKQIFLCFCFVWVVNVLHAVPDDLEIIVEEKPDVCDDFSSIGDTVHVDYTGMLPDGRIFDSSLQEGRGPLKFQLGTGKLIKGWERGIQGMCVGEKRKLIIPPHLGYGNKGIDGAIPPNSMLYFQIHLINLERPSVINQLQNVLNFSVWPLGLLLIVYYLYNKINTAIAKELERKPDRKSKKKR